MLATSPNILYWRAVHFCLLAYSLILTFMLFLPEYKAKRFLKVFDENLGEPNILIKTRETAHIFSPNNPDTYIGGFYDNASLIFTIAHFIGWTLKMFFIRDWTLTFIASIVWEVVETFFKHI